MKGGDLLVLLAIADYADEDFRAWPSQKTLARKARMDERNVRRVLQRLHVAGEILIERGAHVIVGRGKPADAYRLTLYADGSNRTICPDQEGISGHFQPNKRTNPASVSKISDPSVDPSEVYSPSETHPFGTRPDIVAIVNLFNHAAVNTPIPQVVKISADRAKLLAARLKTIPNQKDWETIFAHCVRDDWFCGRRNTADGGHANWIGTLDYLIKSDRCALNWLERAQSARPKSIPSDVAGIKRLTRAVNARLVAQDEIYIPDISDAEDS